jgi:hypothetical protein
MLNDLIQFVLTETKDALCTFELWRLDFDVRARANKCRTLGHLYELKKNAEVWRQEIYDKWE